MRCLYEAQLHQSNCFITLTFSDEFLPTDGSIRRSDLQLFFKRFRSRIAPLKIRFFACGEYGDIGRRPHYHAIIFGYDFSDKVLFSERNGIALYTSSFLSSIWTAGFSTVGAFSFESAAYVARYCLKKRTGKTSASHYEVLDESTGEIVSLLPEFILMSLKPGIGARWYEKFSGDVFPSDFLVVRGIRCRPPRYYDVLYGRIAPVHLERIKLKRVRFASRFKADQSEDRLAVREKCVVSRSKQLPRPLE